MSYSEYEQFKLKEKETKNLCISGSYGTMAFKLKRWQQNWIKLHVNTWYHIGSDYVVKVKEPAIGVQYQMSIFFFSYIKARTSYIKMR
jgi:hypothetical protein